MALFMDPPLNGAPAWLSQALTVVNTADGSQPLDMPLIDPPPGVQEMHIAVGNNGQAQVDNVFVQYWVVAFSTVYSGPLFLPTTNGPKGKQIPTSGGFSIPPPPAGSLVFSELFEPTSADVHPLVDNQHPNADFHGCILANVFSDPVDKLATNAATPPTTPGLGFDPANNPRHAQHNITLVTPDTDSDGAMDFMMHVANPFMREDVQFELAIHETHLRREGPHIDQVDLEHLLRHPRIVRIDRIRPIPGRRPRRLTLAQLAVKLGDELLPIHLATEPLPGLQIEAGRRAAPRMEIGLGAGAAQRIRLQAKLPDEEPNTLRIFDVIQTRKGKPMGGARVLFLNAPAEFRRELPRRR